MGEKSGSGNAELWCCVFLRSAEAVVQRPGCSRGGGYVEILLIYKYDSPLLGLTGVRLEPPSGVVEPPSSVTKAAFGKCLRV